MKILATIAARGGSKGIKNKNVKLLAGKPLISYTIEQVIKWGKFDRFIVSTDSRRVAKTAARYGAEAPFMRPTALAKDNTPKMDALRHALIEAEKYYDMRFDALFDFDATAPMRTVKDIDNIMKIFIEKDADCVFSVIESRKNPYFNMVEIQQDGTVKPCKKSSTPVINRQSVPPVYEMNASMYVYNRYFLLDRKNTMPYSGTAYPYIMNDRFAIDIDTVEDFKFVEFLLKERLIKL